MLYRTWVQHTPWTKLLRRARGMRVDRCRFTLPSRARLHLLRGALQLQMQIRALVSSLSMGRRKPMLPRNLHRGERTPRGVAAVSGAGWEQGCSLLWC